MKYFIEMQVPSAPGVVPRLKRGPPGGPPSYKGGPQGQNGALLLHALKFEVNFIFVGPRERAAAEGGLELLKNCEKTEIGTF